MSGSVQPTGYGNIHAHEYALEDEAEKPDHEVPDIKASNSVLALQEKEIRNLDGNHGSEDRADEVEEVRNVVHREGNRGNRANDRGPDGDPFAGNLCGQGLAGDACGVRVHERGRHRGEDDDQKPRNADAGLQDDLGNVAVPDENGSAHANDVHPAADEAVDDAANGCRRHGLFGTSGVVADEGEPGERHGHGQLHRRPEAHALLRKAADPISAENDHAKDDREDKKGRHGNDIHFPEVLDANKKPDHDECPDDEAPDPVAGGKYPVG